MLLKKNTHHLNALLTRPLLGIAHRMTDSKTAAALGSACLPREDDAFAADQAEVPLAPARLGQEDIMLWKQI